MPQVIAVMLAGAGLYAGLRFLGRMLERELRRQAEEDLLRRRAEAKRVPINLGTLEYDPETETYRPRPGPRRDR